MSLRPEEIDQVKFQLGVTPIRLGAEPYIAYLAIFDRVIQPFLFDASTTSSTAVLAGAGLTSITLAANPTAASGNGLTFQLGTSIVVDVGASQEITTVQSISGLVVTCTLALAHANTYFVGPNGSEQIVRNILARLESIRLELDSTAILGAGAKQVDEINLYASGGTGGRKTKDRFESLIAQRDQARDDLGEVVGFPNLRSTKRASGYSTEAY